MLNSRAILALKNYLDYPIDDGAPITLERLFRDYKDNKTAVKDALVHAFKFLTKERYIPEPDDPPYMQPPLPKPSKDVVTAAKKHVNRVAKKVWKK